MNPYSEIDILRSVVEYLRKDVKHQAQMIEKLEEQIKKLKTNNGQHVNY